MLHREGRGNTITRSRETSLSFKLLSLLNVLHMQILTYITDWRKSVDFITQHYEIIFNVNSIMKHYDIISIYFRLFPGLSGGSFRFKMM